MFNVLEFARNNNVRKVVYPSSMSVYAGNQTPHKESIYPIPRNTYGAAKIACESLASSNSDYVNSTGLRISAVYGPGEEKKTNIASVIYLFLNDIKNGLDPVIFGDGTQARDFIYLDDTMNAIFKSIDLNFKGVINVGSGNSISFNDLIRKIIKVTGKNVKPKYISKQINYVENLKADITLMREKLSINPINIEDGIEKFAKYLKIV
jgi:nucleoside-diphosphate-sugar epimerase